MEAQQQDRRPVLRRLRRWVTTCARRGRRTARLLGSASPPNLAPVPTQWGRNPDMLACSQGCKLQLMHALPALAASASGPWYGNDRQPSSPQCALCSWRACASILWAHLQREGQAWQLWSLGLLGRKFCEPCVGLGQQRRPSLLRVRCSCGTGSHCLVPAFPAALPLPRLQNYGAKGDNRTDDSDAFLRAIRAASLAAFNITSVPCRGPRTPRPADSLFLTAASKGRCPVSSRREGWICCLGRRQEGQVPAGAGTWPSEHAFPEPACLPLPSLKICTSSQQAVATAV